MGLDELRKRRDRILRVAARHGARNVRVIGSVARGEADAQSDVDFLVKLDHGRSLLDHAGLIIDLEKLLGCKVDVATDGGLKERIRERVMREAVAL